MEEGKEAVLREDKVFIPIKYVGEIIPNFEYTYMNKEVHIYLDNYSYILTTDKAYISMLTNEGTLQKVHYIIENGVTKIDFKAL